MVSNEENGVYDARDTTTCDTIQGYSSATHMWHSFIISSASRLLGLKTHWVLSVCLFF